MKTYLIIFSGENDATAHFYSNSLRECQEIINCTPVHRYLHCCIVKQETVLFYSFEKHRNVFGHNQSHLLHLKRCKRSKRCKYIIKKK